MRRETRDTRPSTDPRWNLQDACPDPFEQKMLEEVFAKKYNMTVVLALMEVMPIMSIKQLISLSEPSSEFSGPRSAKDYSFFQSDERLSR